jgi:quercetin dioxygenase-like cupin family protein
MTLSEFQAELQAGHYSPAVPVQRELGYQLAGHDHSFDACALITAGEITLVVDGVATRYQAGDVFRLPAGTAHQESAGPEGVAYLSGRRENSAP